MNDATALPFERPRRFHFDWLLPLLTRPRATFAKIAAAPRPSWLTPLLVLTLTGLLPVLVAGPIKAAAAQSGQVELPLDFEFWTPEQQAQFFQAQQTTSGPVFIYVFPALITVTRVWFGWLVMGGLLHLLLTMLGGRDSTGGALNIVAWASLPFAVRDLVRAGYMLVEKQLITNAGLTGFAPAGDGWAYAALAEVLARVDLYTLWYIVLLYLGVRASGGLSAGKALAGILIALLVMLILGLLPAVIASAFGGLNIVRPFFF
ncbi:MAG: YIP1 family protein [Anaerolineales bacterium]|nr:YIP1 family protein [Anaerolineales bacterium]